jgi:hypothetical protein
MRFVADVMLGKLAKWLRILGYDTLYYRETLDRELIEIAEREGRILLTSDRELLKCSHVEKFYISSDQWRQQLREVVVRFGISEDGVFTRCVECNSLLKKVAKEEVLGKVPPYIYKTHKEFGRCPKCNRIYWKGTHFEGAKEEVEKIMRGGEE